MNGAGKGCPFPAPALHRAAASVAVAVGTRRRRVAVAGRAGARGADLAGARRPDGGRGQSQGQGDGRDDLLQGVFSSVDPELKHCLVETALKSYHTHTIHTIRNRDL